MSNNGWDWRSAAFRQKVILNIDESLKKSANLRKDRNSQDIEQLVFDKANSRESYMTMVARIILALSGRNKGESVKTTRSAEGLEDLCIKAVNKLVKRKDIDKLPLPECVKNCIKKKDVIPHEQGIYLH